MRGDFFLLDFERDILCKLQINFSKTRYEMVN